MSLQGAATRRDRRSIVHWAGTRQRGLSLVELLVAMGIFSVLGMTLVLFLRQGLATWRAAESTTRAFEEAQGILQEIRSDLGNVFATTPSVRGQPPRARLLCDADDAGRQRLSLVRTFPVEARHPLAALSGKAVGADCDLDGGSQDREHAIAGRLRATGGLMEVLYAMDPEVDGLLLRGTHAPVGGEGSLFALENVRSKRLRELAQPLSHSVLYLEFAFFTQRTRPQGDDAATAPVRPSQRGGHESREAPAREGTPVLAWDSTRALLPPERDAGPEDFAFFRTEDSLLDPDDDVFPERVRVTLVVAEEGPAAAATLLVSPLSLGAGSMRVLDARPFQRAGYARVGRGQAAEWVRVVSADVGRSSIELDRDNGRGARGTAARDHAAGEDVLLGRTFTTDIEIPAFAEDWNP